MMSNNTDEVNNYLNRIPYIKFKENHSETGGQSGENCNPTGSNLITALNNSGAEDIASKLAAAGYDNYVIKDYENNNATNGFVAIAIEDPTTGDVGIIYCGTQNMGILNSSLSKIFSTDPQAQRSGINEQIDMIDNISTAVTGDSDQAREALDFFRRNQSDSGDNYLYGHSKGGELAMEVYVENHEKIKEAHIINPQPINWAQLSPEQIKALNNGKIDAVVIDGDLVWLLGGVPYPVRIIENNKTLDGEFFGPHDLQSGAYNPDGSAIIEETPYKGYPGQGLSGTAATILIGLFQGGYKIGEEIAEMAFDAIHFITEELPEYGRKLWESVNNAWGKVKEYGLEIWNNVEDFFSGMSDAAKEWWNDHFGEDDNGSGGRSAGGPCQFRVDTLHLQNAAARLADLSRQIDTIESSISSCARSIQSFSFIGTVALRASLRGTQQTVGNLGDKAGKMANALTGIASVYERSEKQALSASRT